MVGREELPRPVIAQFELHVDYSEHVAQSARGIALFHREGQVSQHAWEALEYVARIPLRDLQVARLACVELAPVHRVAERQAGQLDEIREHLVRVPAVSGLADQLQQLLGVVGTVQVHRHPFAPAHAGRPEQHPARQGRINGTARPPGSSRCEPPAFGRQPGRWHSAMEAHPCPVAPCAGARGLAVVAAAARHGPPGKFIVFQPVSVRKHLTEPCSPCKGTSASVAAASSGLLHK